MRMKLSCFGFLFLSAFTASPEALALRVGEAGIGAVPTTVAWSSSASPYDLANPSVRRQSTAEHCVAPDPGGPRFPLGYGIWFTPPQGWVDLLPPQNSFGEPFAVIGPRRQLLQNGTLACGIKFEVLDPSGDPNGMFARAVEVFRRSLVGVTAVPNSGAEGLLADLQPRVQRFRVGTEQGLTVVGIDAAAVLQKARLAVPSAPKLLTFGFLGPWDEFATLERRFFTTLASLGGTTPESPKPSPPPTLHPLSGDWRGSGAGIKLSGASSGTFERYWISGPSSFSSGNSGSFTVLSGSQILMRTATVAGPSEKTCEYRIFRDSQNYRDRLDICGDEYWITWPR